MKSGISIAKRCVIGICKNNVTKNKFLKKPMNYAVGGNDYPESPLSPLSKTTESMVATGIPQTIKKKYTILLVLRERRR